MLDLFFYKLSLIYTGSPRRFAVLDLLHKKQSLISQLLSFAMFFATSGSLALLDSTLRKSAPRDDDFFSDVIAKNLARDDDFLFRCHYEKIVWFSWQSRRNFQN